MNENAFLIVPYNILIIKELKLSEKIVLAEIISLSKKLGYCFASNNSIAKRTGVVGRTVSAAISELNQKGYICSTVKNDYSRTITLNYTKLSGMNILLPNDESFSNPYEKSTGEIENSSSPHEKSSTKNNSYNNRYNNNYKGRKKANTKRSDASYDINELMKIK